MLLLTKDKIKSIGRKVRVYYSRMEKIALFCKFRFVGQPVRFANVCNVRRLPFSAGRQKQNYLCKSIFQLY